uniref:Protein kinase domain-containing protein n=1 Tax=Kalanchoe fedtschenkoi TaxID=63787 RepID=A0A7N0VC44_KALFE
MAKLTTNQLKLLLGILPPALLILVSLALYCLIARRSSSAPSANAVQDEEKQRPQPKRVAEQEEALTTFEGGEDLTIADILEAPGEVIGKSGYGTVYKAALEQCSTVNLLRFLRPTCSAKTEEVGEVTGLLGSIRHPNLVPLQAFYAGPRGEKLLVHPFYRFKNLAQFIRDENEECHKWLVIHKISAGIAKGLDHLHSGLPKPVIHGNLKSKNILLDRNLSPYISDFGLHLLLNSATGQEMLEAAAVQGYKAPELIKMRDCNAETDVYGLGVILLEILTGKEPVNEKPSAPGEDYYLTNTMRNAILDDRISDLFHPDILLSRCSNGSRVTEERVLKFFQLAMACCSPSPALRPCAKQVVAKLEEISSCI